MEKKHPQQNTWDLTPESAEHAPGAGLPQGNAPADKRPAADGQPDVWQLAGQTGTASDEAPTDDLFALSGDADAVPDDLFAAAAAGPAEAGALLDTVDAAEGAALPADDTAGQNPPKKLFAPGGSAVLRAALLVRADRADAALQRFWRTLPRRAAVTVRRAWRLLRTLWAFCGRLFYEVGYYTEYTLVKAGRLGRRVFMAALRVGGRALWWVGKVVLWLPLAILRMLWQLIWHPIHMVRSIWEIWYTRDPDHPGKTWGDTLRYVGGGIRRNAHLVLDLLGWTLPVAAGFLFVFTVRTVMSYEYVLQLHYEDQVLGYVTGQDVFEIAQQDVQSRIIYTEADTDTSWGGSPSYTLALNDGLSVMDAGDVADALLRTSGEEIMEATGFYFNGDFYGAITDRDRLERELEEIKAPYATGQEGETISFVVEPELVDGVYLRSSLVEYDTIGDLIHGQVAGEVRYTVVTGDTPSGIAHAHGLTTAELSSMNPENDIENHLYPGDSLIVSQAVSFLQVQQTYRRTEMESVPFQTVRTNTADLAFGYTRVATAGVEGVNECVYDYVYIDGVLQSKTLVSRTVISEPVTEEILVGTQVRPGVTVVPSSGGFMWPIPESKGLSRGFSWYHNGMDILAYYGAPIYASQSGVVTKAVYTNVGYGVYVIIDHGGGYSTLYGHCSGLAVATGDIVNQGDLIAYMGSTGNSTGNHCHFEIRINGSQVDPAPYVGYG